MKRVGCLFRALTSFSSLRRAARQAARGKRHQDSVAGFLVDVEKEIESLQQDLRQRRYQPGPYNSFEVNDPKRRAINAPAFRDRVLHHAVCGALEPVLERVAIADSFACRRGKGSHLAVARVQEFARHHRYFLKLDIARFYDSVDHQVLRRALRRLIKDADLLWLLDTIIDHSPEGLPVGKGMAIGNLTSQHFANLYLSRLDHFVKEELGVQAYARYMDDLVFFASTKDVLWQWQKQVEAFTAAELLLRLKPSATVVAPVHEGVAFLGVRIWPCLRRLAGRRKRRFFKQAWRAFLLFDEAGTEDQRVLDSLSTLFAANLVADTLRLRQSVVSAMNSPGSRRASGSNRVQRGGSWNNNARNARAANRNNNTPGNRNTNIGGRVSSSRRFARSGAFTDSSPVHRS